MRLILDEKINKLLPRHFLAPEFLSVQFPTT